MPGHSHARQHGLGARAWALQEVAQGGGASVTPAGVTPSCFKASWALMPPQGREMAETTEACRGHEIRSTQSRGAANGAVEDRLPPPASHTRAGPGPSARSHVATERAKGSVSVPRRAELFRMVQLETPSVGFSRCLCERCVDVSFTALPIVKVRETANCEQDTLC